MSDRFKYAVIINTAFAFGRIMEGADGIRVVLSWAAVTIFAWVIISAVEASEGNKR